jgi:hypothetical protein
MLANRHTITRVVCRQPLTAIGNQPKRVQIFRYTDDATDKRAETPAHDNNYALAALRYLVSKLDAGRKVRTGPAETPADIARQREEHERQKQRERLSVRNEEFWRGFI